MAQIPRRVLLLDRALLSDNPSCRLEGENPKTGLDLGFRFISGMDLVWIGAIL
jgi:hypothetical protein